MSLTDKIQELTELTKKEFQWNLARHVPLFYLPISAIAKPVLLYDQNPIDHYLQDPVSTVFAATGLALQCLGAIVKGENDGNEMQTIIENDSSSQQEMVSTGQYEKMRHPTYFAQSMIAAGAYIMNIDIASTAAISLYGILTEKTALVEEEKNLVQFGQKYQDYMNKVPRWPWSKKPKEVKTDGSGRHD